jgi:2-oxoglutarate dehydrogenase E1 component
VRNLLQEVFRTIDDETVVRKVKTCFCTVNSIMTLSPREKTERKDVAVVRIQLFPLPVEQLKAIIAKYPNADDYVWAQEETEKIWGAYGFMSMNFNLVKLRLASKSLFSISFRSLY